MRWLVVGAQGMLGTDAVQLLRERGEDVVGVDRDVLDITDPVATAAYVQGFDVVLNCAAYTAVDPAESDEATAFAVNAVGAASLAVACRDTDARLVHVSTDYVFEGEADTPYPEDAFRAPTSAYGRTKAAGEWAVEALAPSHLILRTAWLYGAHGACFPRTIVRVAKERGSLEVVADQVGQPTWTVDVADLAHRLVAAQAPSGAYHATSSGSTTWHGFAQAAVEAAGMDPQIVAPTSAAAYARAARRPSYSVLAHDALTAVGVAPIGDWRERWDLAAASVLA